VKRETEKRKRHKKGEFVKQEEEGNWGQKSLCHPELVSGSHIPSDSHKGCPYITGVGNLFP